MTTFLNTVYDRVGNDAGLVELLQLLATYQQWGTALGHALQAEPLLQHDLLMLACAQAGLKCCRYEGQIYVLGIAE